LIFWNYPGCGHKNHQGQKDEKTPDKSDEKQMGNEGKSLEREFSQR